MATRFTQANATQSNSSQPNSSFVAENKGWFIGGLVVSLLLVGLVAYFLQTHERVLDAPKYSLTPQATVNRFLASQRLLQAEHKQVRIAKGEMAKTALDDVWLQPNEQAKHNAVMLYSVSKNQEARIPDMLKWVENGGHLVTFSQEFLFYDDVNKDKDDEVVQDKIRRYQLSENVLLNHLGIRRISNNDNAKTAYSTDSLPTPSQPNIAEDPKNSLKIFDKVVMRLPLSSAVSNSSNQYNTVEAVVSINNGSHLDVTKFWQNYPTAKRVANYNWLDDNNKFVAPNQTVLSSNEQQQLEAFITELEKKYKPSLKADDVMLDVKMGEGRLTVLNDRYVFTNPDGDILQHLSELNSRPIDPTHSLLWQSLQKNNTTLVKSASNIASLDNAYLLKYLMADRQQIWIVPDIDVPSLPVMLWRSAKWACVAFLLLIALGMLALPKRFGRVQTYTTDKERNIFGYFEQVGQYLWHTDEAKALVTQNRTRLIEQIIAKQPQLARLEPDELCQAISEQLNIGKSAVKQGLYNDWQNPQQFLQCTRQFAVIKQAYS